MIYDYEYVCNNQGASLVPPRNQSQEFSMKMVHSLTEMYLFVVVVEYLNFGFSKNLD